MLVEACMEEDKSGDAAQAQRTRELSCPHVYAELLLWVPPRAQ